MYFNTHPLCARGGWSCEWITCCVAVYDRNGVKRLWVGRRFEHEDNIKMNVKGTNCMWTGFIWLRIGCSGRILWTDELSSCLARFLGARDEWSQWSPLRGIMKFKKLVIIYWISFDCAEYYKICRANTMKFFHLKQLIFTSILPPRELAAWGGLATRPPPPPPAYVSAVSCSIIRREYFDYWATLCFPTRTLLRGVGPVDSVRINLTY